MACPVYWPDERPCGGNGFCVNGTCVCEDGWASRGDFAEVGENCDLHEVALSYGYKVLAMVSAILFVYGARFTQLVYRKYKMTGTMKRQLSCGVLATVQGLTCMVGAGLKSSDPAKYAIGHDVIYTALFCSWASSFWISASLMTFVYISFYSDSRMTNDKSIIKAVATAKKVYSTIFVCIAIACYSPLLFTVFPKVRLHVWAKFHYLGVVACMLLMAFGLALPLLSAFVKHLEKATSQEKQFHFNSKVQVGSQPTRSSAGSMAGKVFSQVKSAVGNTKNDSMEKKMKITKALKTEVRNQIISNTFTSLLFSMWPYLVRKTSFQLCVAWIGATIIHIIILRLFRPRKESTKRRKKSGSAVSVGRRTTIRSSRSSVGPGDSKVQPISESAASETNT